MTEKTYDFKTIEPTIYERWLPHLSLEQQPKPPKRSWFRGTLPDRVFVMAPPNVTGALHLGHALENTLIDTLVRWYRMRGERVVWIPGLDHAGIATQNVVEKQLKKEGSSRFQLGREAFIARVWQWKEQSGGQILNQFRRLGIIPDWSRTRFTMDPEYIRQVEAAFVAYHERGLVYRAYRTITWCPRCQTTLSDLEIGHSDESASLYYITYGPITIATVRPETKFGDTAIAVHPRDARYRDYIGRELQIESLDTAGSLDMPQKKIITIRVIADEAVDPNFGTGAIKVTPAHDMTDYEISRRHNLPIIPVIDERGRMNERAGKYLGLTTREARAKILADLRALDLVVREEPSAHRVTICSRCNAVLEPLPSLQWFVKMDDLAQLANRAVRTRRTIFFPRRWEKNYFDWLEHVRDWCISRQLWWGQQLPVWYCRNCPGGVSRDTATHPEYVVSRTQPEQVCARCHATSWERSTEVFDTWFSSALWPFATLYTEAEQRWYPATLMTSGRDILHLWITRMIFSGVFFRGRAPFAAALIHPTILTKDGKRMSKSLGTGVDPLDLIERFGADALRFGLIWQMQERQDIRFDETHVAAGRKFANKIWNATRFVLTRAPEMSPPRQSDADKMILAALTATRMTVDRALQQYRFAEALQSLYNFFWHQFCDTYLESCKAGTSNDPLVLRRVLIDTLVLLHPFMPFITETLWSELGQPNILLTTPWPNQA